MSEGIAGLLVHARTAPSQARREAARDLRTAWPDGTVLLETCHRVELYGPSQPIRALAAGLPAGRYEVVHGEALARHVIALAVGRASTILAEDQILHQLRVAVGDARARGPLPPALDHLLDLALRSGRTARSWIPGRRPNLADLAVDAGLRLGAAGEDPVLVVGAGEMGALAARAVARRGRRLLVTSRSHASAIRLARETGGVAVPFDPGGKDLSMIAGAVVALTGPWALAAESIDALVGGGAWVVDLSSPPALAGEVTARLPGRSVSIDDLGQDPHEAGTDARLVVRLDRLVEETLARYAEWIDAEPTRTAARALAQHAGLARAAELRTLWSRLPALPDDERAEIERMTERLIDRLLRDPLERLQGDADGRHGRAARELFGL